MKIEVAKHARMAERGSSLLKLLQNNDTPLLDLLIREAVQNSLDASAGKEDSVVVDIGSKDFNANDLIGHMSGIEEGLEKRFGGESAKALYIADTNTVGLTGPFYAEEVEDNEYGNLQKLVYEISIPQQKEGAGGSWGLGKTVYFRFGIGLVFYYSRIQKENGEYEHRLAATMVEDENKPEALLPSMDNKPKRGIAWWGQESAEDATVPLTNEKEIAEILQVFSIDSYKGEETGTKIIIPFIDEDRLLPKDQQIWWNSKIDNYLAIAFQRWYSPRLDNPKYPYGSWLDARVGGEKVQFSSMERYFQLVQEMYNAALSKSTKNNSSDANTIADFRVEDINLRTDFKETASGNAGKIAYSKFTMKDLNMLPPENQYTPYLYSNLEAVEEGQNPPLILYLRQPGMIVNYEIDGAWCADIPSTDKDQFIIGVFVPNSESEFKSENMKKYKNLEQYLRRSEKADHTSWKDLMDDEKKITIISRIQNNVNKTIRQAYADDSAEVRKGKRSYLSRSLASKLLPPQNFGKRPGPAGGGGGKGDKGTSQIRKAGFEIIDQEVNENNKLDIVFELNVEKNHIGQFELTVPSETGHMKGNSWEGDKGIGTPFPLAVENIYIEEINDAKYNKYLNPAEKLREFQFKYDYTKINKVISGIEIRTGNEKLKLKGKMKIIRNDSFVQAAVSVATKEVLNT